MSRRVNDLYDFGEFSLDPVRRTLSRGAETVSLTPKALDTLLALIEGRDRVMSKEELMRRVWPDATVEEVGLAKNISAIRKALGERLGEHRFVVTVPGRGYRFVADVIVTHAGGHTGTSNGPAASVASGTEAPPVGRSSAPIDAPFEDADASAPAVSRPAPGPPHEAPPRSRSIRSGALLTAFGLVIAALVAGGWVADARRPTAPLTARDTILLAGFTNRTGDPIFDDILRQGLAAQLEQSPFLNLYPEAQASRALRLLGHPPDDPITREMALELCRRQGVKAFVAGAIAPLGRHYAITLEATDQNGRTLAREQVEAAAKEDVLRALSRAARRLRERLGESIKSVGNFDFDVTTSSLEAMKVSSQGQALARRGRYPDAIPLHRRAIELDPNFLAARVALGLDYWNSGQRELAGQTLREAYALRDTVGEYERLHLDQFYHLMATGDLDKMIETLERRATLYPRDFRAYTGLSYAYVQIGDSEKAIPAARASIRLDGAGGSPYVNLAQSLVRLGRYDEADQVLTQAIEQVKIEGDAVRRVRYVLAFLRGDAQGMQREVDALAGRAEHLGVALMAETAAFAGRWRDAEALFRRAVDLAAKRGAKEAASAVASAAAARAAAIGLCPQARAWANESETLAPDARLSSRASIALALCGDARRVQAAIDDLSRRRPEDTLVKGIWLPIMRAALERQRGNDAAAIGLLEPVLRYEAASEFWARYLRGQSYLRLGQGPQAAAEFRAIIGARGQGALLNLYPLAALGLARAATLTGDTAESRKAYSDFLGWWKDADPDLPPLVQARAEARAAHQLTHRGPR